MRIGAESVFKMPILLRSKTDLSIQVALLAFSMPVADEPAAPLREHRCARPLRPLIFRPSVPVVDVDGISPACRPAEVYDKIGHYAVPKKTL